MTATAAHDARPAPRWRRVTPTVLLVITTIVSLLAVVAVWANRLLLNPDNWSKTSTQLLQRPAVRQATANYLVEQLYQNVDVQGEIGKALSAIDNSLGLSSATKKLPGSSLLGSASLDALSGPISDALRGVVKDGVNDALETSVFATLWEQANRLADQSLVAIVDGHKGPVGLEHGTVSLDLSKVLSSVSDQIGIGSAVSLPAGIGTVEIMHSDQLKTVQDAGRILRSAPDVLIPLALVLYALAILFAPHDRRRRTLMAVGLSLIAAGLLALTIRSLLVSQVPGQLVSDASIVPAARDVVDVATQMLVSVGSATWQLGALIIIGAWLAGPSQFIVPVRRAFAPLVRREAWSIYAALFVVLLVAFLWHPFAVMSGPVGMLAMVVGGLVGTEIVRRQMLRDFPEGTGDTEWLSDVSGTVTGWMRSVHVPSFFATRSGSRSQRHEARPAATSRPTDQQPTVVRDESPTVARDEQPTAEVARVDPPPAQVPVVYRPPTDDKATDRDG